MTLPKPVIYIFLIVLVALTVFVTFSLVKKYPEYRDQLREATKAKDQALKKYVLDSITWESQRLNLVSKLGILQDSLEDITGREQKTIYVIRNIHPANSKTYYDSVWASRFKYKPR